MLLAAVKLTVVC